MFSACEELETKSDTQRLLRSFPIVCFAMDFYVFRTASKLASTFTCLAYFNSVELSRDKFNFMSEFVAHRAANFVFVYSSNANEVLHSFIKWREDEGSRTVSTCAQVRETI